MCGLQSLVRHSISTPRQSLFHLYKVLSQSLLFYAIEVKLISLSFISLEMLLTQVQTDCQLCLFIDFFSFHLLAPVCSSVYDFLIKSQQKSLDFILARFKIIPGSKAKKDGSNSNSLGSKDSFILNALASRFLGMA